MKTGHEKLSEKKPEAKKPAKKDGLTLSEIRVKPLEDGSHHIVHHYEDKHHMPHHHTPGYSAATKQDVADHMMEHLPEAPQQDGAEAAPQDPAAAAGGAPAGDPGAGAEPQGAPGQE